ncbi:MAG: AMP-binding protein [Pyrinomonadaceae bacterium]|nr:AMP-binding protein [Pyrinomonadaceae bacterium]
MKDNLDHQPIAWKPTAEVIEHAQLTKFMQQVGAKNWDELYQFSINDVEKYTAEVLKFLDIKFDPPYEKLLDTSEGIEWSKWCVGGGLNISEMCLDRWIGTEIENQPAIIWEGEDGNTEILTYAELLEQVKLCAAGLRANGFGKGAAIGIHLPMIPETVILLMAIARIGAIAVPVFSGYGVDAIASRMNAVSAKALFTINDFPRRGKRVYASQIAFEAAEKCPTIEKVFTMDGKHREFTREEGLERAKKEYEEYLKLSDEEKAEYHRKKDLEQESQLQEVFKLMEQWKVPKEEIEKVRENLKNIKESKSGGGFQLFSGFQTSRPKPNYEISFWKKLLMEGRVNKAITMDEFRDGNLAKVEADFNYPEPTSANDPLIILYTSGTTGKPKGIAHVHCGFPIKAAEDMAFGTDVGKGTRISWVTDIGWMMGPWLIYGALLNGATMVLYDGSPDYPNPDRMWEFTAKHKVEILGISPTLVRGLATKGDDLPKKHDLSSLRVFASTGEPWNPEPWRWLFEVVGDSKLPIINYSGGTEISGGILMNNPLVPIKPCGFSAPCLGIDADVLDENGESVADGKVGELAIKKTWLGMAQGFWNEPERYLETYWNRFENIWVHGDFALKDEDGHWFILGRSDDTLKVAGKRVGPAEVESILVGHEAVAEAAVIGIPDEIKGTAMIAFCVLKEEKDGLEAELKQLIAKEMGKPLQPNRIYFISALPKTRNAKVMRRVIRAAYLGEDAGDLSALENPKTVEEIRQLNQ